jgi:hypothetical protein
LNVDHYVYPYFIVHYSPLQTPVAISLAAIGIFVAAPAIWMIVRKSWLALPLLLVPVGIAPYFFIPAAEMMVEYKFYLSLAAFCVLLAAALSAGLTAMGRAGAWARGTHTNLAPARTPYVVSMWLAAAIICLPLGLATASRNADWRTDLALWEDAAAKVPRKARTINALALALVRDKERPDPPRALMLADRSFDSTYVDTWYPKSRFVWDNAFMRDTQAEVYCAYAKWCAAKPRPDLQGAIAYFDRAIALESMVLDVSRHFPNQEQGNPAFYERQIKTFQTAKDQTLGQSAASRPASEPAK